jgi:hypothetical protein
MRWCAVALAAIAMVVVGCPPPARYTIERPGLGCDRATRVAYKTLVTLGYRVTGVVPADARSAGRLTGVRTDKNGHDETVGVRITCDEVGSKIQPLESDLIPSFEFSRSFGYSFKSLVQRPDEEVPRVETGLSVLVHAIAPQEAIVDLGGEATTGDAVAVRITVRNHTDRAVRVDPARMDLVTADGRAAAPLAGAALGAAIAPGAAGDRVRREAIGAKAIAPHTTVAGFLVYPPGRYAEARVAIEDVETEETEGFVVPVQ